MTIGLHGFMNRRGRLIAFDGISASGKGTQINILKKQLENMGEKVVITEWNSDKIISPIISKAKRERILYPELWSIIHAIDFLKRYNEIILTSMKENKIVIADRYIYTAFARDVLRGVNKEYINELYSYAIKPDLYFWINTDVGNAYKRRINRCKELFFYSSGCDIYGDNNYETSWKKYSIGQHRVFENIKRIDNSFFLVNGDMNRESVHQIIWKKVKEEFYCE